MFSILSIYSYISFIFPYSVNNIDKYATTR